jgi:hypothetical protein
MVPSCTGRRAPDLPLVGRKSSETSPQSTGGADWSAGQVKPHADRLAKVEKVPVSDVELELAPDGAAGQGGDLIVRNRGNDLLHHQGQPPLSRIGVG